MKNLLKIGTIGFGYRDWEGFFYPSGLPTRDFLKFYNRTFNAVELDTTFYGAPKSDTVNRWISDTEMDFKFCVKTPRQITHQLGLVGTQELMSEFCDSIRPFSNKLGAVLIQLPPGFTSNQVNTVDSFLQELPGDLRFAIEFRNISWYSDETFQLLSKYGVCWVATEYPGMPANIRQTTNFLYIRWIGEHGSYKPHTYERVDKTAQLEQWWDQIQTHLDSIESLYGFFNNDYAGFAAATARRFMGIIGLPVQENNIPGQRSLF
jgi:uncharacterized protein YecE (DUF72 family)